MSDISAERLVTTVRRYLSSAGVHSRIMLEPATETPRYESFWLVSVSGGRTGIVIPIDVDEPARRVLLADQVQDFLHEELSALGKSTSWPECPEHPNSHPLRPQIVDGTGAWVCPKTQQNFGEL